MTLDNRQGIPHAHLLKRKWRILMLQFLLFWAVLSGTFADENWKNAQEVVNTHSQEMTDAPGSGVLSSSFTLGRLSPNGTFMNTLFPYVNADDAFLLGDYFHVSKSDDKVQVGLSGLAAYATAGASFTGRRMVGNPWGFLAMIPQFDILAAPSPEHRLSLSAAPRTLWFYLSDDGGELGAREPFVSLNSYSWRYLSHGASISLAPDEYEQTFHFGPQLDKGQVRAEVSYSHLLMFEETAGPTYAELHGSFARGLSDKVALGIAADILGDETNVSEHFYENTGYVTYNENDSQAVSFNSSYRAGTLGAKGGYRFKHVPYYGRLSHHLYLDISKIFGESSLTFAQVNGNYDGIFSPLLGERQLLLHGYLDGALVNSGGPEYNMVLTGRSEAGYGVNRMLTVAHSGWLTVYPDGVDLWMALRGTFSNMQRRLQGPDEVSSFEYHFGHYPRTGEFRVDVEWLLPMESHQDRLYPTDEVISLLPHKILQYDMYWDVLFNRGGDQFTTGPKSRFFSKNDLEITVAAGITKDIMVTDEFLLVQFERYHWSFNEVYDEFMSIPTKNTMLTNQLSIHLGNPEKSLSSINLALLNHSDKRIPAKKRFDYLVSYVYTTEL